MEDGRQRSAIKGNVRAVVIISLGGGWVHPISIGWIERDKLKFRKSLYHSDKTII
jgi:hypothetical protein